MKVTSEQVQKSFDYLNTRLKKLKTDREIWADYISQVVEKSDEESALEIILSTVRLNKDLLVTLDTNVGEIMKIMFHQGYTVQIKPPTYINGKNLCQILYWKE